MSNSILVRLNKLEAHAMTQAPQHPKMVRIVSSVAEEQEAYRQAAEDGLDISPDGNDILIIRLISTPSPRQSVVTPDRAAIEKEYVGALLAAVDGKTRTK